MFRFIRHIGACIGWWGLALAGVSVGVVSFFLGDFKVSAELNYATLALTAMAALWVTTYARNVSLTKKLYPEIAVHCGENIPNSVGRNFKLRVDHTDPRTGQPIDSTFIRLDLFGFTLTNKGTSPVQNCEALLIRISNRHIILSEKLGRLPAEPRNQGRDLEEFVLWHNKPQPVTLCSVTDDGRVMIGSGNLLWRHGGTEEAFNEIGEYFFDVRISGTVGGVGIETIEKRFTFLWGGDRASSHITGPVPLPKR